MVVPREERPLIKRPVLYIGSAVPIETTEGLDAIQQPLKERYPEGGEVSGINSFLSIVPSGLLLQYKDDPDTIISFPITSLTICAAVRRMKTVNGATGQVTSRFVSLNSPQARSPNSKQPAIFSAITRRTKGRRVLECHGFICASDKDAMDLVSATSHVDQVQKRRSGTIKSNTTRPYSEHSAIMRVDSMISTNGADITQNGSQSFIRQEQISTEVPNVRLIPGIEQPKAAPEFYEPPPSQGYFYGSAKVEVQSYNVEKTIENGTTEPEPPIRSEVTNGVEEPKPEPIVPPLQLSHGPPFITDGPRPMAQIPPRRPMYVPVRTYPPPPRARFFSPPPTFVRRIPVPYMGQPPPPGMMMGPPPPPGMMMGPPPPLIRRSHRRRSHSSGGSRSKSSSRGSSPKPEVEDTELKRVPNADLESESDVSYRPRTPPRDYDPGAHRQQRVSRRDEFEMRRKREKSPKRKHASPRIIYPPYGPQYYPYPGYPYMPPYGGRSRSMPPPMNERHVSPSRKKGKKNKKNKKKNKQKGKNAPSDISHGSYGYHSEIPRGTYDNDGYSFYPPRPRDFRRIENQFMNEKSFSKRIHEENRKSKGKKEDYYPTAYELNEALNDGKMPRDADFAMY